jgi:cyclopropane fatty-acyl-phospholipid synthase-like methyltransferase
MEGIAMLLLRKISRRLFFFFSYFQKPRWDTGISPPELLEFIQTHSPGQAIDFGCGTGTNVITLAQHGWKVTGIDFIPKAIHKAKQKIKEAGVEADVKLGDVTRVEVDGRAFDLALDIGCYHNLNAMDKIVYERNLQKIIARGGVFLLYGFLQTANRQVGIQEDDLARLQFFMHLTRRVDGIDQDHASAWFTFTKVTKPLDEV